MIKIYKYPLQYADHQTIIAPKGAKFFDIQLQQSVPCLWTAVDPDVPTEPYNIYIVSTGNAVPSKPCFYVATFQIHGRGLVFHVFAEMNPFNL